MELAHWIALLLFLAGVIALIIEVFVIPGFGVAGVTGVILMIWSVILIAVDFEQIVKSLTLAIILTFILFFVLLKLVWSRFSLFTRQSNVSGYNVKDESLGDLVGEKGLTVTPLRPSGNVEIDNTRYDAITEGEFIEVNQPIVVSVVKTSHLVVKKDTDTKL
ncbi:MAG TPA: NfeD family protein [Clostridia bacterium]|nr:NfeD family protein [Clostridia bacterium]